MPTPTPTPHPMATTSIMPASPTTYVLLPQRLLEDLRDAPAAVGAYTLIARLYLISGEAVPLSPGDLLAYDPALSYGSARRALDRLVASGYALASGEAGRKLSYRPTWGAARGTPHLWERGAPCLGRPRHIRAVRLDDRLLDLCMGRLRPHKAHRAVVERYLAAPLLGLREIGAYGIALAGLRAPSATLATLGLVDSDGAPMPLPDDRTVLALASQRALPDDARAGLTPAGWRHAGLTPTLPDTNLGDALFFVPVDEIGGRAAPLIGRLIASSRGDCPPDSSSERHSELVSPAFEGSHGLTDHHGEDRSTTSAAADPHELLGGGQKLFSSGILVTQDPEPRLGPRPAALRSGVGSTLRASDNGVLAIDSAPPAQRPHTNTGQPAEPSQAALLLRSIGVRDDVANSFAGRPVKRVAQVIAQARSRHGVRDVAGWVVSALRAVPDSIGEPTEADLRPPSALPIHTHPGLSDEQRDRWIRRFRAAPSPYEQRALLARLEQEHPR